MADNRTYPRDPRTGQFAKVDVEQDVIAPSLGTPRRSPTAWSRATRPTLTWWHRAPRSASCSRVRQRSRPMTPKRGTTKYGLQGRLAGSQPGWHGKSDDPIAYPLERDTAAA